MVPIPLNRLLLVLVALPTLLPSAAAAPTEAGLRVIRVDEHELLLELTAPAYALRPSPDGLVAMVAGLSLDQAPGAAALPFVALPIQFDAAPPQLTLLDDEVVEVPLPSSLARAPLPLPLARLDPSLAAPPMQAAPTPTTGLEPSAPAVLLEPNGLRGQSLAQLRLAPLQVDWERGTLRWHKRLLVALRFDAARVSAAPPATDTPFAALLDSAALNPSEQAAAPREATIAAAPATPNPAATIPGSLKLLVDRAGTYEVTAERLAAAGWDLATLDPTRLQLTRDGVEVPLQIVGQGSGFELRFRGEPANTRYQAAQVYWLAQTTPGRLRGPATPGPGTPLRWGASEAALTPNKPFYSSQYGGHDGDGWFIGSLRLIDSSTRTITVPLALVAPAQAGTRIVIELQSAIDGDHAIDVGALVGGADLPLGQVLWNDDAPGLAPPARVTLTLPRALPSGALTLKLTLVSQRTVDEVYVDEIIFPDLLEPEPLLLAPEVGADTPSSLASGAADYLIISHAAFADSIRPLADYHRSRGRQVRVVDVQDIYDEWSFGRLDPGAIRAFVSHAYRHWSPAPRYLLLVGEGTSDFRNYLGVGDNTFIPPFLSRSDPWLGEIACDTCFARVAGPNNAPVASVDDDLLPDLMVGRLPVRTADQAAAVAAKIVGYATRPPLGSWRSQNLFLADRARDENGVPDSAGDFFAASEQAIAALPQGARAQRFFYDPAPREGPLPNGHYAASRPLRQSLLAALDAGAALLTYNGHANFWQWGSAATSSPPYLWSVFDADGRKNGGKLPILLSMTCLTGLFQEASDPELGTTDERLVIAPSGGAVASLSPSGLGVAHGHDILYDGVVRALYGPDETRALGAAHLAGFVALAGRTSCCRDMFYSYQLFGDPATELPKPQQALLHLPLIRR